MKWLSLTLCGLACACSTNLSPAGEWIDDWEAGDVYEPEIVMDAADSDPAVLRVGSYNVHFGANPTRIAGKISSDSALSQVDVWLIQEIESHPSEVESRAATLASALGMNYVYAPARQEGSSGTHGIAILTSVVATSVRVRQLPKANVALNPRRRLALSVEIAWDGGAIEVINFHLDTRINPSVRVAQLDPALRGSAARTIAGGDTNDNRYTWTENLIPNVPADVAFDHDFSVVDEYARAMGFDTPTAGVGSTVEFGFGGYRLDAIFSKGLRATRAGAAGIKGSDHIPIWVDIERAR